MTVKYPSMTETNFWYSTDNLPETTFVAVSGFPAIGARPIIPDWFNSLFNRELRFISRSNPIFIFEGLSFLFFQSKPLVKPDSSPIQRITPLCPVILAASATTPWAFGTLCSIDLYDLVTANAVHSDSVQQSLSTFMLLLSSPWHHLFPWWSRIQSVYAWLPYSCWQRMMVLSAPLTFLESLRLTVKSVLRQWCRVSEESMPEPYCGVFRYLLHRPRFRAKSQHVVFPDAKLWTWRHPDGSSGPVSGPVTNGFHTIFLFHGLKTEKKSIVRTFRWCSPMPMSTWLHRKNKMYNF